MSQFNCHTVVMFFSCSTDVSISSKMVDIRNAHLPINLANGPNTWNFFLSEAKCARHQIIDKNGVQ